MQIFYLTTQVLSSKAQDLVQFDVDSIRQVAAGSHATPPTIFLADPDQYEHSGRLLRDSNSPRLLGYSPEDRVLYANDGCNSCTHRLTEGFDGLSPAELRTFANANKLREELVSRMADLIHPHPGGVKGA